MGPILDALTGWTLFAGLALVIGVVVSRWAILPRALGAEEPVATDARRGAARLGTAGAGLTLVGVGLYLVRQLLEFRDPFVPLSEDLGLLMSTPWGTTWTWTASGVVALLAALLVARTGRSAGWWAATPLALALAAFPGLTGHAAGVEGYRTLALAADTVHVWAVGAWIGGLAVVLRLEARWRKGGGGSPRSLLPRLVPAFSPIAMGAVGLLVLTGVFAAWTHLEGGFGALVDTDYGRTLLLKVGLVAVVLGLGARNFRILTPRLGTEPGDDAMRYSATMELAVAQVVLVVTALLVRTSPMGH